jgi:hypothetical protein
VCELDVDSGGDGGIVGLENLFNLAKFIKINLFAKF